MKDIQETTISEMQKGMDSREYTSRELVLEYFSRISRYDTGPEGLNSVLELNPEAPYAASAADAERKNGHVRGPLHGIPVLLKEQTIKRTARSIFGDLPGDPVPPRFLRHRGTGQTLPSSESKQRMNRNRSLRPLHPTSSAR